VPGVEELGGGRVGFGVGTLVGVGGEGCSTSNLGEGAGTTGAFLLLEFAFALPLALVFTPPALFGSSAVGEANGEASGLALGLSVGVVPPPTGIPASGAPVGGLATSTGWPFGSAAKVEVGVVSVVGFELRVNA
jgi:hypothetical protein